MSTDLSTTNQIEVLARSLDLAAEAMTPEVARYLLNLELSENDRAKLDLLAEKSRQGALSAGEHAELDEYRRVGRLVELMKVKAKLALKH